MKKKNTWRDSSGTIRWCRKRGQRRRKAVKERGLWVVARLDESGGWARVVLSADGPRGISHVSRDCDVAHCLATGHPYHATLSSATKPEDLCATGRMALCRVREFFGGRGIRMHLPVQVVSPSSHVATLDELASGLAPIMQYMFFLRWNYGGHTGAMTVSM